jgi:hypothetical protein
MQSITRPPGLIVEENNWQLNISPLCFTSLCSLGTFAYAKRDDSENNDTLLYLDLNINCKAALKVNLFDATWGAPMSIINLTRACLRRINREPEFVFAQFLTLILRPSLH